LISPIGISNIDDTGDSSAFSIYLQNKKEFVAFSQSIGYNLNSRLEICTKKKQLLITDRLL
jgi:hypothetical protein